ncbi:MAG: hypothetical protein JOY71_02025 [Acetobacteraceae bacterium]|nr:hypothetical protein [Acetobacteraceae bacterium]MBV8520905.1 hypothetical protein [Acetobacteraceae bacterium]
MVLDLEDAAEGKQRRVVFTQQSDLLEIAVGEFGGRLFSVATSRGAAETVARRMHEAADLQSSS